MQTKSKVETFIGFAIRSSKYKIGVNAVKTLKRAKLIIVCHTASENTLKEGQKLAKALRCPILITITKPLAEYVFRANAKVMAITDDALAKAIIDNKENQLKVLI